MVAKKDFKKDETVSEVFGDTVGHATDYTIPLNETERIEPRLSKTVAQFMNHSCEPNIYPDQTGRIYLAMRGIHAGEELATHYGFLGYEFGHEKDLYGEYPKIFDLTCHCGAATCKGVMRAYKDFTLEEKGRYKDSVLPFLRDR